MERAKRNGCRNHACKEAVGVPFSRGAVALYFQRLRRTRVSSNDRLYRQLPGLSKVPLDASTRECQVQQLEVPPF